MRVDLAEQAQFGISTNFRGGSEWSEKNDCLLRESRSKGLIDIYHSVAGGHDNASNSHTVQLGSVRLANRFIRTESSSHGELLR